MRVPIPGTAEGERRQLHLSGTAVPEDGAHVDARQQGHMFWMISEFMILNVYISSPSHLSSVPIRLTKNVKFHILLAFSFSL